MWRIDFCAFLMSRERGEIVQEKQRKDTVIVEVCSVVSLHSTYATLSDSPPLP
jgi:hypothetical protein